ncbi:MAG TPA: hypothetical protein VIO39_06820 [Methylotenera sp.]|jgi:hypothetical protein
MDKRIEKSNQSILGLRSLLRDICMNPGNYLKDENLTQALKSQNSLSKLSVPEKSISPSSINTLKRTSESILEGGFEALDALRKSALNAIERKMYESKQPDKETKTGLSLTIKKLEHEKQSLRNDLLLLTLAFEKALRQGARYALLADSNTQEKCKKEQRELLDILSLRKHSFNTNVVKLRDD